MSDAVLDRPTVHLKPHDALRPDRTVWVAASAGAGKTTTLTNRVLSLLMHGTAPGRILCLTFTKAAAAEMALRVNKTLGEWARLDDAALKKSLRNLLGRVPTAAEIRRARGLFGTVLDVPGGMKIQTIHAFCQSLLRRFPLEATLPPYFEVMDDRVASEMILAAREEILCAARAAERGTDPDAAQLAAALETITTHIHEDAFNDLMGEIATHRGRLRRLLLAHDHDGRGGADGACAAISRHLGLKDGECYETILADGCADGALDGDGLRHVCELLSRGTATDRKNAAAMSALLAAAAAERAKHFDGYCSAFHTQKGEISKKLISKAVASDATAVAALQAEAERLLILRDRLRAAKLAEHSAGILRLGSALLKAYEAHKIRRACLDYEDLILRSRDLLRGDGELARNAAAWVLFKLDGGLDHILVDEAQDTSPEQWEVIAALAEEFFSGEGARETTRTIFAVGDLKQSIYSFQGADPEAFQRMRSHFYRKATEAQREWLELPQFTSYRSTAAVLDAVDAVFAQATAADGVAEGAVPVRHVAHRLGQGGVVELWPPVAPEEAAPLEPWQPPTDVVTSKDPAARLASVIAKHIESWVDTEKLPSRGRAVCPGDVMVLVRRRTAFVDSLVRNLKTLDVPVAGSDRLTLTEQLAVMDLVAFGQFLLLPNDDLNLAIVLKSPLVGLSETQLFEIAYGRKGTLWRALQHRAGQSDAEPGGPGAIFRAAYEMLSRYLGLADYLRPYDLYSELLSRDGGRRKLLGRLGVDAEDPIAEFLGLALAYERQSAPSLQGFLHWFASGQAEIKRDLEQGVRDEVRIMTVHGAKGLQAPIVILPDTMRVPNRPSPLLWSPLAPDSGDGRIDGLRLPLWSARSADDDAVAAAERAAAMRRQAQEYRRLLYVALTRAEDRLYVCGWMGKTATPTDCWYNLVRDGLQSLADKGLAKAVPLDFTRLCADGWSGTGLRFECSQDKTPDKPEKTAAAAALAIAEPLPDWAQRPAKPEPKPSRPLAPSKPDPETDFDPPLLSPFADDGARFQRGIIIHRLLQTLPDVTEAAREAAARRYLARPVWNLSEAQQEEIAAETLRVLGDPRFAPLFGVGSRAEVAITGRIGNDVVSGQIDRLVALPDRVIVVDYKSNRPPPKRVEDVPRLYLRQLAAYKALLLGVYPGKRIDCALLWTDGPFWMELPESLLAPHIPS